ncbi:MAG: LysM peptidoglycan-binding domain-containing protein [Flavobacteriaceae bacterium]|nr:LysM peptidoglycan-binding domain-containing protein [Flavobacteriaceae bacterium]
MRNFFFFFLLGFQLSFAQTPESFISHRVKKGETLIQITERYNVSQDQILEFNSSIEKTGIKRRMTLRIPIYSQSNNSKNLPIIKQNKVFDTHTVNPKETKWRLAYEYKMTIKELDSLNPQIIEGLEIGQEIRVRNFEYRKVLPEKDPIHNYYKVLKTEGFYRIEKKLGVDRKTLDSLNPILSKTGLQVGMILRIPDSLSGKLKIENDLLVERVNLLDSTTQKNQLKLGILLPFKVKEIIFDSLEDTKKTLAGRNLHTLSLDFYTGVLFALEKASKRNIEIELKTYDTDNDKYQIKKIIDSEVLKDLDLLIGPLIPTNFDFISNEPSLKNIPKIAPLSSRSVKFRKNVFQSVTSENDYRNKMYEYLETKLDSTQNIIIVADHLNHRIEKELQDRFPWAIKIRPEKNDYIIPELVDSLLIDSIPNKVILETQSFPLIASAISQFNAQNTRDRDVQLFTTYRSNAYDNDNLSRKVLGGLHFTYSAGSKPLDRPIEDPFIKGYVNRFGKPPNKEAVRGYDITLDAVLRIAVSKNLKNSLDLGETQYESSRFLYRENSNESFINQGKYILQHDGYEIIEIKE